MAKMKVKVNVRTRGKAGREAKRLTDQGRRTIKRAAAKTRSKLNLVAAKLRDKAT